MARGGGGQCEDAVGGEALLLTWGMKDFAFRPKMFLPRWQRDFPAATLVELAEAKHYIQEDAPEAIAAAIRDKYGSTDG